MIPFIKKLYNITTKKDRKRLFCIFVVILISTFLDLVGISAILPIVSLLSSTDIQKTIDSNFILKIMSFVFNNTDKLQLSIIALLFFILVFLIKTLYSFLTTYVISKFTMTFSRRLSLKLMNIYLNMPYEFHHENNSSTLIRKSTYDVDQYVSAINGFLNFLVRALTTVALVIYLAINSWLTTLIISALLIIFSIITLYFVKGRNKKLGHKIQELNNNNYKYMLQAFNGIKESKISNTEYFFANQYNKNVTLINNYRVRYLMYSSVPSYSIEFIGLFGLVVSLLIIILIGRTEDSKIIETFAVFVYAVVKLLPCVTIITSFFNNLAFYSSSIDVIEKDLNEVDEIEKSINNDNNYTELPFNEKITLSNVSFAYKDAPQQNIIKHVNLEIKKNTSVAFTGSSGAGKTTLIDIILGLLKPSNGKVLCDEKDINKNPKGWRDNLSYIPQNIYLTDDSIRNNVAFGIEDKFIEDADIWDALDKAQLKDFVEKLPNGLDTCIGERGIRLSGGQRQRIGIARAIYRNSNVIVFDEATSALDYETERNIFKTINSFKDKHTIIIITHRLNTISKCDYIYKVENGQVQAIKL